MHFSIDPHLLSENKVQRREFLDAYFPCGWIPYEEADDNGWTITCFVPDTFDYYVDPYLPYVLSTLDEPITALTLPDFHKRINNSLFSFYDSWSLYYWSQLLSNQRLDDLDRSIILLHIDDHTDLSAPHLYEENGTFFSLLSDNIIDLQQPATVAAAIQEKSIGIDAFIAPLLHRLPKVKVLHFRPGATKSYFASRLACTHDEDKLIRPGARRPALSMNEQGQHFYAQSNQLEELLPHIDPGAHVLLHFDADAFCNRFDMDQNWEQHTASIDLSLDQVKVGINSLFRALSSITCNLHFNAALSPGFFPSQYWRDILPYLYSEAKNYRIIDKDGLIEPLIFKPSVPSPHVILC